MSLFMFTDSGLSILKDCFKNRIDDYAMGNSFIKDIYDNYNDAIYQTKYNVELPELTAGTSWQSDLNNCIELHKCFKDLPISFVTDERFITYLAHHDYYNVMVKRWPISGETAKEKADTNRLKQRYFFGSQEFTRNYLLRLIWFGYITYDKNNVNPYHLTEIAFRVTDPVNQLMERKYSKNRKIIQCALQAIENLNITTELNKKRTYLGKMLNNMLSIFSLDIYNNSELIKTIENEIRRIIDMPLEEIEDEDDEY